VISEIEIRANLSALETQVQGKVEFAPEMNSAGPLHEWFQVPSPWRASLDAPLAGPNSTPIVYHSHVFTANYHLLLPDMVGHLGMVTACQRHN
jgi:hypothetical protein